MPLHLAKGSERPSLNPDKIHYYDMLFCPFSSRVRLVLAHHKFDFEHVFINLASKPEWYVEDFPPGKVPVIVVNGEKVVESEVVCKFLDDKHPEHSLFKQSGDERFNAAKAFLDKIFPNFYNVHLSETTDPAKQQAYIDCLKEFEAMPKDPFLSGDKVGIADYFIIPLIDRIEAVYRQMELPLPTESERPTTFAWLKLMRSLPAVQAHRIDPDRYYKFGQAAKAGKPDYTV